MLMMVKLRRRNAVVVMTTSFVIVLILTAHLGLIIVTSDEQINMNPGNFSASEQRSAVQITLVNKLDFTMLMLYVKDIY